MASETKVVYYLEDEDTPYLIKLNISPERVTLGDFKNALYASSAGTVRRNLKFFFKSEDQDFGVVKEEIFDDNVVLPSHNGRILCWLVSADGSGHSDSASQCTDNVLHTTPVTGHVPTTHMNHDVRPALYGRTGPDRDVMAEFDQTACTSDTESTISGLPQFPRYGSKLDRRGYRSPYVEGRGSRRRVVRGNETSSALTSDLDTTSFVDSEDDRASRMSSSDITSVSRVNQQRSKRRSRRRVPRTAISRTSSFSSITESSMSLNIITVTLNMDTVNFLGISVVGHSKVQGGDGGIYVGSIMKGGAVALDGRIEVGDLILQVNDVSFDQLSNDDAAAVLRNVVNSPSRGPIKLVVAKCWDNKPRGYFTMPRTEAVQPIDPAAWVAHTNAMQMQQPHMGVPVPIMDYRPPSASTLTSNNSGSLTMTMLPESGSGYPTQLTSQTPLDIIVRAMARPDSGLDVKDRMWLKINIPNAFIGSDVVDWLQKNVAGLEERRAARRAAAAMLKQELIKHTVNKITFSEPCYYVFCQDLCQAFATMKLASTGSTRETEVGSEVSDDNTLPPLPPFNAAPPPYVPPYLAPGSMGQLHPAAVYAHSHAVGGSVGSLTSAPMGGMGGPPTARSEATISSGSAGSSGSDRKNRTLVSNGQSGLPSEAAFSMASSALPPRPFNVMAQDMRESKQSFRMAMGNPCGESFFVDMI